MHVEQMKRLTCPVGKLAVTFGDGTNIIIPCQEKGRLINELTPLHGQPKSVTDLPENERELAMILKRERFKRSYHATPGDLKKYMDGLEKSTLRGKLKEAQAAAHTRKPPSHKREAER